MESDTISVCPHRGEIWCCPRSGTRQVPFYRRYAISTRPVRVNERIRVREVRLIDEDGTQLGVVLTRDALDIARERGLDLVEVQPNAIPPVCRLMDYGRFRYEESRKERESRKKSKGAVLKEVRIYPKIGEHDLHTKARQAQRFLEDGDKVKVAVLFRGREMLHQDIGRALLQQVVAQLQPVSTVDQEARMEGRMMSVLLSPKKEFVKVDGVSPADLERARAAQGDAPREEAQLEG